MLKKKQEEQLREIINKKELSEDIAQQTQECMIELCQHCDTQKSLAKLNDIFYNLSDGIILFNLNFDIVDANKLGKSFLAEHDLFDDGDKEHQLKELPALIEASDKNILKFKSFDKKNRQKVFNISCSNTYSPDSRATGTCIVINDVTEVEKQVRQLEDMMASFTHDLKTPLIALELNINHILEGEYGHCNELLKTMLQLMSKSASRTLNLVKNLLTIFKYDSKSHKLLAKNIKVKELINNAISSVDTQVSNKKAQIITELESNFTVFCDSFEIERVLTNLLSNAIKFSNPGDQITISVSKEAEEFFKFSIEDKGIGISEIEMKSLFGRFWQSKAYDSSTNGTGLGLYLSRQIIEAHGGSIWAESEKGKGTKVHFKIPSMPHLVSKEKTEATLSN